MQGGEISRGIGKSFQGMQLLIKPLPYLAGDFQFLDMKVAEVVGVLMKSVPDGHDAGVKVGKGQDSVRGGEFVLNLILRVLADLLGHHAIQGTGEEHGRQGKLREGHPGPCQTIAFHGLEVAGGWIMEKIHPMLNPGGEHQPQIFITDFRGIAKDIKRVRPGPA